MTITQVQLNTEISTNLPSTGAEAVSASILRITLTDIVTAIFQGIPPTGLSTTNTWTALQTFNGGAIVPTQGLGDNTTNAASTAFVQNQLSSISGFSGFGNPTVSIGLTAINGSATTAIRSDASPALSQSIVPTWTGLHTFSNGISVSSNGITTGSAGLSGTINFPFNGENLITLTGGNIGSSGLPRLLFKPSTAMTPPNNTLVGFGTDSTWPFTYEDYQSAIVTMIDPNGAGALFTAIRSSDWTSGNVSQPIGTTFLGVHDKTGSGPNSLWNIYAQFNKTATASSTIETFLCEMSYSNLGASVTGDPYNVNNANSTHLLRIDSGTGGGATNAVTTALEILNNSGKFNAGICIGSNSITTVSSHINAIQLPSTYEVVWFTSGSPGVFAGSINVDNSNVMQFQSAAPQYAFNGVLPVINFTNNGSAFITANGGSSSNITMQANSISVANFAPTFVSVPGGLFTVGGGLQMGSPTGGDRGSGTINVATNIFLNNSAYTNPDYVFEYHYTGKIEKFINNSRAKDYQGLMNISDLRDYIQKNFRLPRITDEPTGVFTMADIALEKIEELVLYVLDLHDRITELENGTEIKDASR